MDSKKRIDKGLRYIENRLSGTPLARIKSLRYIDRILQERLTPDGEIWVDVGGSKIKVDTSDDIGRRIYYDDHEREIKEELPNIISEGETIVDVGGHYGYYTAIFRNLVGENGKVVVIEPNPKNAELLEETIEHNGWANVELVRKAISNTEERVNLNSVSSGEGRSFIDQAYGREGLADRVGTVSEVEAVPLSSLIQNLQPVDLVKIDIEGAELEAVKGINREFDSISTMIIEIHSHQPHKVYEELYRILSSHGVLRYIGANDAVNPDSLSKTSANLLWEYQD